MYRFDTHRRPTRIHVPSSNIRTARRVRLPTPSCYARARRGPGRATHTIPIGEVRLSKDEDVGSPIPRGAAVSLGCLHSSFAGWSSSNSRQMMAEPSSSYLRRTGQGSEGPTVQIDILIEIRT